MLGHCVQLLYELSTPWMALYRVRGSKKDKHSIFPFTRAFIGDRLGSSHSVDLILSIPQNLHYIHYGLYRVEILSSFYSALLVHIRRLQRSSANLIDYISQGMSVLFTTFSATARVSSQAVPSVWSMLMVNPAEDPSLHTM